MTNPVLRKLGFPDDARVAIIHADDIGMCQATLPALADLLDAGLVSSAATMVPCPWFAEVAAFCRGRRSLDMGVHLTTTCEYGSYRWGPISTRDAATGLLDGEGYFHGGPGALQEQAVPEAVWLENEAQLARARAAGIDVTHVDTHQLAVVHGKFLAGYAALARQNRLPLMLLRLDAAGWQALGRGIGTPIDAETGEMAAGLVRDMEAQGWPLIDGALMLPLDRPEERIAQAKQALDSLPPGITHFVLHPAVDTPELRAITADWPSRVADYQAFSSRELRDHVRGSGLHVIGYRALRDLL